MNALHVKKKGGIGRVILIKEYAGVDGGAREIRCPLPDGVSSVGKLILAAKGTSQAYGGDAWKSGGSSSWTSPKIVGYNKNNKEVIVNTGSIYNENNGDGKTKRHGFFLYGLGSGPGVKKHKLVHLGSYKSRGESKAQGKGNNQPSLSYPQYSPQIKLPKIKEAQSLRIIYVLSPESQSKSQYFSNWGRMDNGYYGPTFESYTKTNNRFTYTSIINGTEFDNFIDSNRLSKIRVPFVYVTKSYTAGVNEGSGATTADYESQIYQYWPGGDLYALIYDTE